MSVNSDEVAAGIIKAVSQIALVVGVVYCVYTYPWLLLLLIPVALVWIAWKAWHASKEALERSPSTSHKIGVLILWGGIFAVLVGSSAYYLLGGNPDWAGWSLLGGLLALVIGAVVKDQAEQRELKRRGPTKSLYDEMREQLGDPEEQEQRKRDAIKRAQDEMTRILNQPKK